MTTTHIRIPRHKKQKLHRKIPHLGYVYIWSVDPELEVVTLLGETAPTPTKQGYGGWEQVKRVRKPSLTQWAGVEPLQMSVSIILDHFADQLAVENDVRKLERMAGYHRPGVPATEPPLVRFDSNGVIPHDFTHESNTEWHIADIEWGDSNRRSDGLRVRQAMTLIFEVNIEDDNLAGMTSAQRRKVQLAKQHQRKGKAQQGASVKRYVVPAAMTLERIAAEQLGNANRWREIRRMNPKMRDPRRIIKTGTIISLP